MSQAGLTTSSGSGGTGITEYFSAYLSAPTASVTGDGSIYDIVFDVALSNAGGHYNTGTGVYSVATTGQYSFSTSVAFNGGDASTAGYLVLWDGSANYSGRAYQLYPVANAGGRVIILSANIFVPMAAGQSMKIGVLVEGVSKNVQVYGQNPTSVSLALATTFSGFKVA